MRVFAIGDLHLSGSVDKPMDIFGAKWDNHAARIRDSWRETVQDGDIVLLPGDFSWAMHLEQTIPDFAYLSELPGKKILIRGNHDYWWNSITKVRLALPAGVFALQNDSMVIGGLGVAGTRGWVCPGSVGFSKDEDQKIYDRELTRLKLSIESLPKETRKIVMLHYPPFNEARERSGFTDIIEANNVELVLYGHLHGRSCKAAFEGNRNGVEYRLVSADHIGFAPRLVLECE